MDRGGRPPGPPRYVAPLHLHYNDDEAWYVLEGVLRFRIGDEEVEAGAGAGVQVRRGIPHTYWNPGPGPARYLLVVTPNIYALIQAIHASSDRSFPALSALFGQHGCQLLGAP